MLLSSLAPTNNSCNNPVLIRPSCELGFVSPKSNNNSKPLGDEQFQKQQQQGSENDLISVLYLHNTKNSNYSRTSTTSTTTPNKKKENLNDDLFGKALEVLNNDPSKVAHSPIHSPFSMPSKDCTVSNSSTMTTERSNSTTSSPHPQRLNCQDFASPLPSLSKPFSKLSKIASSSFNNNNSSSNESLSSEEDGHCLYGSPKQPKTPTRTFASPGFLNSPSNVSCNSSTNSLSTTGSRIYDPSTSPSIVERRRSRTLASCDAYQKTIEDYLNINCIENYIPTITNNSMRCIQVTLKIDSYIKGFESEVLTDCQPLEHECVSPTLGKPKKKEKPQFASVVVSKKNCKSKKHLETQFKTMILQPNSTTNITPNSFQIIEHSSEDSNVPDCVKNVKKHYSYEIISKGFVKGNSSPSQSDLYSPSTTLSIVDQVETMSSSESSSTSSPTQSFYSVGTLSRTLSANEEMRQCTTPPPRLESLRKIEIPSDKGRPRRLTIGSVKYAGEPYKPPVIHQILLTMKQRRNIRDLINIIDNNVSNDSFSIEGDWKHRLEFLALSPDSFVLIRDQEFLQIIGDQYAGYSCFTYAAKIRRLDILKMLCKNQPGKVYESILLDIDQLEKIIELKDKDVIKILITALQFHIDNERNTKKQDGGKQSEDKKKVSLAIRIRKGNCNQEDEGIETESFIRKYVARNFISIDDLNAVKTILEMNLVSVQMAAKIAVTMSKVNTLRFLLSRDILKPNDYFEGGNVLHWAVLNRAHDVIKLVCSLRSNKKGHRVNVKSSSASRLQPFNGMTPYEIAKSVYDQAKMSNEEKLICEHLQPTKAEFIKGVVDIVVHKVIN